MKKIIQIKEKEARAKLRWIQSFASKDDARPVLTGILFNEEGLMVAADGFRLGFTSIPEGIEGVESPDLVAFEKKVTGATDIAKVDLPAPTVSYPDVYNIVPSIDPTFQIAVNPRLLGEILMNLPKDVNIVVLSATSPHNPMEIHTIDDDGEFYAILMPMNASIQFEDRVLTKAVDIPRPQKYKEEKSNE